MKEEIKLALAQALAEALGVTAGEVINSIETPKNPTLGELAFPCFSFAKRDKISPRDFAEDLSRKPVLPPGLSRVVPTGQFLNFFSTAPL